jgi:hypothetical protein
MNCILPAKLIHKSYTQNEFNFTDITPLLKKVEMLDNLDFLKKIKNKSTGRVKGSTQSVRKSLCRPDFS